MKTSELIKGLQDSLEQYGDLNVSVAVSDKDGNITNDDNVFIGYDQCSDRPNECNVRNFIY